MAKRGKSRQSYLFAMLGRSRADGRARPDSAARHYQCCRAVAVQRSAMLPILIFNFFPGSGDFFSNQTDPEMKTSQILFNLLPRAPNFLRIDDWRSTFAAEIILTLFTLLCTLSVLQTLELWNQTSCANFYSNYSAAVFCIKIHVIVICVLKNNK